MELQEIDTGSGHAIIGRQGREGGPDVEGSLPSSLSSGKENSELKRMRSPSRYICSPYKINKRGMIQPNIMKLYNAITTLCDIKIVQDKWAINIDKCRVSLLQLGKSMKPDGWADSYIINAFLRKLFRENHLRKSNKRFFLHTATEYFLEKYPNDYMKKKWKENVINSLHGAWPTKALDLF